MRTNMSKYSAGVVILSTVSLMYGCTGNYGPMGGGHMYGMGGGFIWLIWIAVGVAAFYFIYHLVKQRDTGSSKSPVDILKERYARGEITKEEFEEMKKDL